jgi:hypothetical protein
MTFKMTCSTQTLLLKSKKRISPSLSHPNSISGCLHYVDHHKNNNRNICNESTIIDLDTHIYSHIYTWQWIWANVSLFTHSITIFFLSQMVFFFLPRSFLSSFLPLFFLRLVSVGIFFFMFVKKIIIFFSSLSISKSDGDGSCGVWSRMLWNQFNQSWVK